MLEHVTDAEVNSTLLATSIIVGFLSKMVNRKSKKTKKTKMKKKCEGENCDSERHSWGRYNKETGDFRQTHCERCKDGDMITSHDLPKIHTLEGLQRTIRLGMYRHKLPKETYKFYDGPEGRKRWTKTIPDEKNKSKPEKKKGRSYIKLFCVNCQNWSFKTNIANHIKRGDIGCKCRTNVPWQGRREEYKNYLKTMDAELIDTPEKWKEETENFGHKYKPKIKCLRCGGLVDTTTIESSFAANKSLGCKCRSRVPWQGRREEFKDNLKIIDAELIDTPKEWEEGTEKFKLKYKPKIKCLRCEQIVDTTTIDGAVTRQGRKGRLGCDCRTTISWSERDPEVFKDHLKTMGTELSDTPEEWKEGTNNFGHKYKPKIKCLVCTQIVDTTTINHIFNNNRLGCKCKCRKTQLKFSKEIEDNASNYPYQDEIICDRPGYYHPNYLKDAGLEKSSFDVGISLLDPDDDLIKISETLEEIDGLQHFRPVKGWKSTPEEVAKKDGIKARLALEQGSWMIRYDQTTIWNDKMDWHSYRKKCHNYIINQVKQGCPPEILVPETHRTQYELWAQRANVNVTYISDK